MFCLIWYIWIFQSVSSLGPFVILLHSWTPECTLHASVFINNILNTDLKIIDLETFSFVQQVKKNNFGSDAFQAQNWDWLAASSSPCAPLTLTLHVAKYHKESFISPQQIIVFESPFQSFPNAYLCAAQNNLKTKSVAHRDMLFKMISNKHPSVWTDWKKKKNIKKDQSNFLTG